MEKSTGEPSFYNVQMKLRILNLTKEDFGTYKCLAKNSQGETDGEIQLYGNKYKHIFIQPIQTHKVSVLS